MDMTLPGRPQAPLVGGTVLQTIRGWSAGACP